MGIFDEALAQNRIQAENSAMATEATLKAADEQRTANLIAYLAYLPPSVAGAEKVRKIRAEIEKRLDIA